MGLQLAVDLQAQACLLLLLLLNVNVSLQSGCFWATSIASFRERLLDFRSCWILFIHVVWQCPSDLLQFCKVEAIFLPSVSSGICAVWPNGEKCRAWTMAKRCGWPVGRLTSSSHTWWYHLIRNSFRKHHWNSETNKWWGLVKYSCIFGLKMAKVKTPQPSAQVWWWFQSSQLWSERVWLEGGMSESEIDEWERSLHVSLSMSNDYRCACRLFRCQNIDFSNPPPGYVAITNNAMTSCC